MKNIKLRFINETAKTQDLSVPAVSGEALVFGQVYTVAEDVAVVLMQQGGWQPVETPSPARKGGKAEPVTAPEAEGEN